MTFSKNFGFKINAEFVWRSLLEIVRLDCVFKAGALPKSQADSHEAAVNNFLTDEEKFQ